MRFALDDALDRVVPVFVLPFAFWTMYVNLITATQSSFVTLLHWLPLVVLIAVAATVAWFHLPEPRWSDSAAIGDGAIVGTVAARATRKGRVLTAPLVVLALSILWVGLLSAGIPYPVFWWVTLLASCGVWIWTLRNTQSVSTSDGSDGRRGMRIVCAVVVAAVCVTLVANRPDADDAFYLSIPATLLRFPDQPVLLHDTMYRLLDQPILLPFYRLNSYGVLTGALARITGIDHLVIAYLIFPSLFAMFCVLAWVYLLRRIVPARWPSVLVILFLCVLALGEVHRAYGNFAFVRMFQGKAILATCMVPVIAGSALRFARSGGARHWLLLVAAQIAALGVSASALFVAPAAAALGLVGGWSASTASSRRFAVGIMASAYVLAAGMVMASITHGGAALVSIRPMPGVPEMLNDTWGPWSTRLLLVALLAAWAFVRDPVRARYFSAGAFFFLLAALNPYTVRFVANHLVGAATYWRLTWVLPLPFLLAVLLDGVVERALRTRSKVLTACALAVLAALGVAFGWRCGTLRSANFVTLGIPGIKVDPAGFATARQIANGVPENGVLLAPEGVSIWLPLFIVHPELLGVRVFYLHRGPDGERRRELMQYVAGQERTTHSTTLLVDALRRYRLTAVAFVHSAPWRGEIEDVLEGHRWRPLSVGAYDVWVKRGSSSVAAHRAMGVGVDIAD